MKYLALVAACLLAVTLAGPAVADDSATPTFTWPTVTTFNSDVYAYTVEVSGPGDYPYRLQATSNATTVVVSGPGSYVVPVSWGPKPRVQAFHCVESTCTEVASSPDLRIVRSLYLNWSNPNDWIGVAPDGSSTADYTMLDTFVEGTTLTWYVVPRGGDPADAVASGPVDHPAAKGSATFQVPAGTHDGDRFDVILRAEVHSEAFGDLAATSQEQYLTVDEVAPTVRLKLDQKTVYPVAGLEDWGYPSMLNYHLAADEATHGTLTFTGPDGTDVDQYRVSADDYTMDDQNTWNPIRRHVAYPEGRYEVRLDVTDDAGHPATATASVYVSHAKQHRLRLTKVVPAARTLVDRSVGACSSLTFPSSHHWKGSIGYVAQARCDRPADSHIVTLHRIYLPTSFKNYYSVKLSFYGVAATSKPGSAIASGWVNRKGGIDESNVAHGPKARWNVLPQLNPHVFKDERGRAYVLFALGTGDDDRYDVKAFRYTVGYTDFS